MVFIGEVISQSSRGNWCFGEEASVIIGNVDRIGRAYYREICPSISIYVPISKLKNYPIGRKISINIKPK